MKPVKDIAFTVISVLASVLIGILVFNCAFFISRAIYVFALGAALISLAVLFFFALFSAKRCCHYIQSSAKKLLLFSSITFILSSFGIILVSFASFFFVAVYTVVVTFIWMMTALYLINFLYCLIDCVRKEI